MQIDRLMSGAFDHQAGLALQHLRQAVHQQGIGLRRQRQRSCTVTHQDGHHLDLPGMGQQQAVYRFADGTVTEQGNFLFHGQLPVKP